jgi:RHS repeat-associated protein
MSIEQITSAGTVTYLHHDQQGSTRLLTGSTGTVTGSTTFDAYGNKTGSTGSSTTPLGYDAQYTSGDTGLIYLRARSYDPTTAQFMSRDPLTPLTEAPYNYVGDDPLNGSDPSGLIFGIPGTPSWSDMGTRLVGFFDGFTKPVFGGTASLRSWLGLNGGLETCSAEYQTASEIGGIDVSVEAGTVAGVGSETLLDGVLSALPRLGPVVSPLASGSIGSVIQKAARGESVSVSTVGQGAVGGFAGELGTGFFANTSSSAVSSATGAVVGLAW